MAKRQKKIGKYQKNRERRHWVQSEGSRAEVREGRINQLNKDTVYTDYLSRKKEWLCVGKWKNCPLEKRIDSQETFVRSSSKLMSAILKFTKLNFTTKLNDRSSSCRCSYNSWILQVCAIIIHLINENIHFIYHIYRFETVFSMVKL